MILVDSSVIFDHTRGKAPRLAGLFKILATAVCGVTRAEVLLGARNPSDWAVLRALLDGFSQVPTPDTIWNIVGVGL